MKIWKNCNITKKTNINVNPFIDDLETWILRIIDRYLNFGGIFNRIAFKSELLDIEMR